MKIDKYGIAHFYDGGEGGGGDPSGGSDPGGGGGGGGGGDPSSGGGGDPSGGSDPSSGGGGSDPSSALSVADAVGMSGFDNTGNFGIATTDTGPGGTDIRDEISSIFGGTGAGFNITGPITPEDAEVLAAYASGRIGYNWSSPLGREARSILDQLEDMGYGKMTGINPRNPSQTVDNLIGSSRTNWAIENLGIPALIASVPGAGTFMGLARGVTGLLSGQITPEKFGSNVGIALLAHSLGLPSNVLSSLARGDVSGAAKNVGIGALASGLGKALNVPSGVVGVGLNAIMKEMSGTGGGSGFLGSGYGGFGGDIFGGGGGGDSGSYDPTQTLERSFRPLGAVSGYDSYQLADVRPGLQKTPFGYKPYGDYYYGT